MVQETIQETRQVLVVETIQDRETKTAHGISHLQRHRGPIGAALRRHGRFFFIDQRIAKGDKVGLVVFHL